MKRLFLALALVLSGAVAEAQIVTEPFSGGTITTPLLGPESCANPTYSFVSDPDSGFGSDGFGICANDDEYFTILVDNGAGSYSNANFFPADTLFEVSDGTGVTTLSLNAASGLFRTFDNGIGDIYTEQIIGGQLTETLDRSDDYEVVTLINQAFSVTVEGPTTDTADFLLNGDVTLARLRSFLGTDSAEFNVNSGQSILLDADIDNDADGLIRLLTDNSGQSIQLDSDSVDLFSNNEIDLNATTLVDINVGSSGTVDVDAGTNGAISLYAGQASQDTLFDMDNDNLTMRASGSGDYYVDVQDSGGFNGITIHAEGTATTEGRVTLTPGSVRVDGDNDNSGDGTVIIEAANSASQVTVNSTGVTINNYLFADSVAFAALGAPANGAIVYCTDCDPAISPCQSTPGTGAFAFRQNGAWACPF